MVADSPHRILVIDDDASLLRAIRLALHLEGFLVETANDGLAGLEKIKAAEYDIIVLDLHMPGMDGRTFYHQLRSRGISTPVLVLSAYGAEAARRELRAEGALNKPFDPLDLVAQIRRFVACDPG